MPNPRRRVEHYFSDNPSAPSQPRTVKLTLPDLSLDLVSDAGVFAGTSVDAGTRLLLTEVPMSVAASGDESATNVLDLGCGYGAIAITAALRMPDRTVWTVDVNERAIALTSANAEGAGTGARVRAVVPADVPPDVRFRAIYSNPPIRIGKTALHDLLRTWLDRLDPDGDAFLVVHKNLGSDSLHRWLEIEGHAVERLVSRMGYRVLKVRPR